MKTSSLALLCAALALPAAFFSSGCSKGDDSSTAMDKAKADVSSAAASTKDTISDSWTSIKDYTYDRRVEFSASIDRMSAKMDDGIHTMKTKMSGVPDAAAHDRDSAMKDYDAARADLKARLTDLGHATADTWSDAKAKVAQAWQHVDNAYARLTAPSTS